MSLLRIENLVAKYGKVVAVDGISLEVNEGEIVCLIGSNGAGKSTTLMTVSGWVRCASGRILFEDREIQNLPMHRIVDAGICQVPEGRRIFPDMTVEENLLMGYYSCRKKGKALQTMRKVCELFPVLEERRGQIGRTLSGGEQQMLAIARALMGTPKLLMMDEPSLGLAPLMVEKVFETIKRIHDQGCTILLVEQNARAALSIADRGYAVVVGKITLEGTGNELLNNDEVRKAYLGGR
ncbi:MAG: ABC transporter ATP-binding protein [Ignavibacteriales bacterium]